MRRSGNSPLLFKTKIMQQLEITELDVPSGPIIGDSCRKRKADRALWTSEIINSFVLRWLKTDLIRNSCLSPSSFRADAGILIQCEHVINIYAVHPVPRYHQTHPQNEKTNYPLAWTKHPLRTSRFLTQILLVQEVKGSNRRYLARHLDSEAIGAGLAS